MGRTAEPHPAAVCTRHPNAPRRWKQVRIPGQPNRLSVCSACSPPTRLSRCVNGHVDRVRRGRKLICRTCARKSSRAWYERNKALLRGDPWAASVAAVEAAR